MKTRAFSRDNPKASPGKVWVIIRYKREFTKLIFKDGGMDVAQFMAESCPFVFS